MPQQHSLDELASVQQAHTNWLGGLPGVTGSSVGLGQSAPLAIKIHFQKNPISAETRQEIEQRLAGYPVEYQQLGEIRAS